MYHAAQDGGRSALMMSSVNGYVVKDSQLVRAALYARVSSEQQAQAGTIGSQVAAIEQRVQQDGLPLRRPAGMPQQAGADGPVGGGGVERRAGAAGGPWADRAGVPTAIARH
jgi:hypothetical protein